MDEQLQSSLKLDTSTENDDLKLSTLLVATIQDAKDRISQIEYIFCRQFFPKVQSKSKLVHRIHTEARKAADVEWKAKEKDLLLTIERLENEKQQTREENESMKLERANDSKEQREKMSELLARIESQQIKINELELNLKQKSKEVDEGLILQNSLLQLNQAKDTENVESRKQLKEKEAGISVLLAKLSGLDREVKELQDQVREKTAESAKANELKGNLFNKIELQASEIMNSEKLLREQDIEIQKLLTKLKSLEGTLCQLRACQNSNSKGSEVLKNSGDVESENKRLSDKVRALEEKICEQQVVLGDKENSIAAVKGLYEKTLESNSAEVLAEKKKTRAAIDSFKRLKSQYNYLCKKLGLSEENMIYPVKSLDGPDLSKLDRNPITLPVNAHRDQDTSLTGFDSDKGKSINAIENDLDNEETEAPVQPPKCVSTVKSATLAGSKRRASIWRDTRSHQGPNQTDPHDDFLDTPLEKVRGNLSKATREEASEPRQVDNSSSDDETQDLNADQNLLKGQIPVPVPVPNPKGKEFKFVEPVRKKVDRENLKGVECRQCKKFYDAVHCGNNGKESGSGKHEIRCEHHEGVSRHRYRYVPPMTPEGFWNIGFESEM